MSPICLIIPPSSFLLDSRVFPFLGILRIAAVLEQAGIAIEVLDLSGIKNFTTVISDYVHSRSNVNIFAITATTPQMPAVSEIVSVIHREQSVAKIILGGPHITLVNSAYKNEIAQKIVGRATHAMARAKKDFDVLVAGDGEEAIFYAIKENSPKLIDADDKNSPLFLDNVRLNALPFPARHLFDLSSYHYSIEEVPATSLIAQLGCPFDCGFCGGRSSPMLRKIRTRSSENVVSEMVHIYETYGLRGFMFYDDELNVNRKMVELMNLITRTQRDMGVEWRLRGFIKSELFTRDQADAMYQAGFRWILTGFESGSPKILTNINKKATRDENTRCVMLAHEAGLKVKALMSIGHPGETRETSEETRQWLLSVKPDDFDLTIITCYPGTPYYDQATPHTDKSGIWVYKFPKTGDHLYQLEVDYTTTADYYKGIPDGGYKAYVYTDYLSSDELVALRDQIERSVRCDLNIPFNVGTPSILYEHSMGQPGVLPSNMLRVSRI